MTFQALFSVRKRTLILFKGDLHEKTVFRARRVYFTCNFSFRGQGNFQDNGAPDKTAFAYDVTEQNADGEYAIYCKVHIDGTSYPGQIQKDGTVIYIKDSVIYTRGK